jgi:uncharacterized membrane protein YgcG
MKTNHRSGTGLLLSLVAAVAFCLPAQAPAQMSATPPEAASPTATAAVASPTTPEFDRDMIAVFNATPAAPSPTAPAPTLPTSLTGYDQVVYVQSLPDLSELASLAPSGTILDRLEWTQGVDVWTPGPMVATYRSPTGATVKVAYVSLPPAGSQAAQLNPAAAQWVPPQWADNGFASLPPAGACPAPPPPAYEYLDCSYAEYAYDYIEDPFPYPYNFYPYRYPCRFPFDGIGIGRIGSGDGPGGGRGPGGGHGGGSGHGGGGGGHSGGGGGSSGGGGGSGRH